MTHGFTARTLTILEKPQTVVTIGHSELMSRAAALTKMHVASDKRDKAIADTLHRTATAAYHLRVASEGNAFWPDIRPRLEQIDQALRGCGVIVKAPLGEPLDGALEEEVDILGERLDSSCTESVVHIVVEPIVWVGEVLFKGKVHIKSPRGR